MQTSLLASAQELAADDWARLDTGGDPFISRVFLGAAEDTGAAGPELGWQANHLIVRDDQQRLAGMLPLYLGDHSFGDFSRDWNWAPVWERAGLAYYPKLVTGVPYTPSPGPRLLLTQGESASETLRATLVDAAIQLAGSLGASSWQCLFVREDDRQVLENAGLLMRRGVQFHWRNRGYRDFDDFLGTFTADKRKKLKRERRAVSDAGLRVQTLHGNEIDDALWPVIHRHYRTTFQRYGNHPAFSPRFFQTVGEQLGRQLVIFMAWQGDVPVASSICYRDAEALYGRHWGCETDCPGLHFELCYYQGIAYAIAEGLQRFEPGAQGEHKLARGFEPVPTWSGFWIADARMRAMVADFVRREDSAMQDYQAETARHLPFKATTSEA